MTAVRVHHTATTDVQWDADANIKRLPSPMPVSVAERVYAFIDRERIEDGRVVKDACKFPHHMVDEDGGPGPANVVACSAGIAVLNGGRGGADVSDAERSGVYAHLAAHLRDADREPPELKHLLIGDIERRTYPWTELHVLGDETQPRIVGHAAVFNALSEPLGAWRELIEPGAFRESIQVDDVRALFNHDPSYVLGRSKAGTLALSEDEVGLRIEIIPPDTQWARDLLESMRRGDIDQMSFGFRAVADRVEFRDGETIRVLEKVQLFDVSVATFPAYPQTTAEVRARLSHLASAGCENHECGCEHGDELDVLRRWLMLAE